MKIFIGADHGGFVLKEALMKHLSVHGAELKDVGVFVDEPCDYPDIVAEFRAHFLPDKDIGVLICGSGQGVCMAANRIKGIRAALCRTLNDARLARQHNKANVVCLGGRISSIEEAIQIVTVFMEEKFEGGRHARRVEKLEAI